MVHAPPQAGIDPRAVAVMTRVCRGHSCVCRMLSGCALRTTRAPGTVEGDAEPAALSVRCNAPCRAPRRTPTRIDETLRDAIRQCGLTHDRLGNEAGVAPPPLDRFSGGRRLRRRPDGRRVWCGDPRGVCARFTGPA